MPAGKRTKDAEERGLIERLRLLYPWFPPGNTRSGDDPPDFVHECDGERIAIEVTRLFHPSGAGSVARRESESFHRAIMRRAAEIAIVEGLPVYDVLVYFNDRELMEKEKTATALVEFVKHHPVEHCETFDPPDGLGIIRIARPLAGQVPAWTCGESGSEAVLTRHQLADVIQKKNNDLQRYRAQYDRAWLLIASTLFPLSASFSVPDEIEQWRFAFDFDKVLLLAEPHGRVFNLARSMAAGSRPLPHSD